MGNLITLIRIVVSFKLVSCTALSPEFYVLYILGGVSDMIDGAVARKTNTVSEIGSNFDTIADFIFVLVCATKVLKAISTPMWIYLWIIVVAFIKVINVSSGYALRQKIIMPHTTMNKVTGLLLFILPFTLSIIDFKYSAIVVLLIATFAAVQEGHLIRTGCYDEDE